MRFTDLSTLVGHCRYLLSQIMNRSAPRGMCPLAAPQYCRLAKASAEEAHRSPINSIRYFPGPHLLRGFGVAIQASWGLASRWCELWLSRMFSRSRILARICLDRRFAPLGSTICRHAAMPAAKLSNDRGDRRQPRVETDDSGCSRIASVPDPQEEKYAHDLSLSAS